MIIKCNVEAKFLTCSVYCALCVALMQRNFVNSVYITPLYKEKACSSDLRQVYTHNWAYNTSDASTVICRDLRYLSRPADDFRVSFLSRREVQNGSLYCSAWEHGGLS